MIDNYDSFTYNLVQYLEELGARVLVKRHDELAVADIAALAPRCLVISPGPGAPRDAGISCDAIRAFTGKVPILGVCLGASRVGAPRTTRARARQSRRSRAAWRRPVRPHTARARVRRPRRGALTAGLQCMFEVFGGTVSHAGEVVHGKSSDMFHDGKGVFEGAFQVHTLATKARGAAV